MSFLKTLFWIMLTVIAVTFAYNNWKPVEINLWGGMVAEANLPLVLMLAFLIGFVPMWAWHRGRMWQLRRQTPGALPVTPTAMPGPTPIVPVTDPAPAKPIITTNEPMI